MAEAESAVLEIDQLANARIAIGATPGAGVYLLPEWIQSFNKRFPDLATSMQTDTTAHIAADIGARKLDLGFVEGELAIEPPLSALILSEIELFVIVGSKHPWAGLRQIEMQSLHGHPFITRPPGSQTRTWIDQLLAQHGVQPHLIAEFDNPEAIMQAVASGLGVTILPDWGLDGNLTGPKLHRLAIKDLSLRRMLKLIWNADAPFKPVSRAFLSHLADEFPQLTQIAASDESLDLNLPRRDEYRASLNCVNSPTQITEPDTMTLRVHLLNEPSAEDLRTLISNLDPDISISTGEEYPPNADLIDILVAGRPQRAQLSVSPTLSRLIIPWAGVPAATRQLLLDFPEIDVHNLHHNAAPTAELAISLLLAAAKFVVPFDRSLRENDWRLRYKPNPSMLLEGKTALILGYGHIGQRVGRFCQALGMSVIAVRRHPNLVNEAGEDVQVAGLQALPDLLTRTHALLITFPATHETEGLIGEEALQRMPPGGILVNVGRGSIVDQGALPRLEIRLAAFCRTGRLVPLPGRSIRSPEHRPCRLAIREIGQRGDEPASRRRIQRNGKVAHAAPGTTAQCRCAWPTGP